MIQISQAVRMLRNRIQESIRERREKSAQAKEDSFLDAQIQGDGITDQVKKAYIHGLIKNILAGKFDGEWKGYVEGESFRFRLGHIHISREEDWAGLRKKNGGKSLRQQVDISFEGQTIGSPLLVDYIGERIAASIKASRARKEAELGEKSAALGVRGEIEHLTFPRDPIGSNNCDYYPTKNKNADELTIGAQYLGSKLLLHLHRGINAHARRVGSITGKIKDELNAIGEGVEVAFTMLESAKQKLIASSAFIDAWLKGHDPVVETEPRALLPEKLMLIAGGKEFAVFNNGHGLVLRSSTKQGPQYSTPLEVKENLFFENYALVSCSDTKWFALKQKTIKPDQIPFAFSMKDELVQTDSEIRNQVDGYSFTIAHQRLAYTDKTGQTMILPFKVLSNSDNLTKLSITMPAVSERRKQEIARHIHALPPQLFSALEVDSGTAAGTSPVGLVEEFILHEELPQLTKLPRAA